MSSLKQNPPRGGSEREKGGGGGWIALIAAVFSGMCVGCRNVIAGRTDDPAIGVEIYEMLYSTEPPLRNIRTYSWDFYQPSVMFFNNAGYAGIYQICGVTKA